MSTKPHILILKTGTTNPPVVERYGDYDDWFQQCLQNHQLDWTVVKVYEGQTIPDIVGFDGVMITGSPSSVWEQEDWMVQTIGWLEERVTQQDIPILAVCFGHQLLGAALGGTVEPNHQGAENGTIGVQLNLLGQQDPLFQGLSETIQVQSVHKDIVVSLPDRTDTICLGSTTNTVIQALGVGQQIRSVQFHPEIIAPVLRKLFEVREQQAHVFPSTDGVRILDNWIHHWILPSTTVS